MNIIKNPRQKKSGRSEGPISPKVQIHKINKLDFRVKLRFTKVWDHAHPRELIPRPSWFFCLVFYTNSMGFQQNFDRVTQDSDLAWHLLLDERYKEFSNRNATSVPTKSDCWTRYISHDNPRSWILTLSERLRESLENQVQSFQMNDLGIIIQTGSESYNLFI